MLTVEMKSKIEEEVRYGKERISGIRMYRILGCHLDDNEELWVAALAHFAHCRNVASEKLARSIALEQDIKLRQAQREVKCENQRLKKSRNQCFSAIRARIQYVLKGDCLTITLPKGAVAGMKPAKVVRAHLRSKGIFRTGRTLLDG
ncbi:MULTISPECIES: hypothetical protein [Shewanella]|jgi:hypothetical protein|uniref:Uncharacterized protein n=1 Tax=Shewanella chilikensis TaxID=558541 RepID=A0A6G7LR45_9GAMM|nr:hypothetical protein [Shewanella chilikensis]QIJ04115.1 hypothetical protein GII14_08025 [Shewanella chilikensis]